MAANCRQQVRVRDGEGHEGMADLTMPGGPLGVVLKAKAKRSSR